MIRNISIGIDVGSSRVRVVVGEFLPGEKNPRIIGVGEAATGGLRHGYVVDSAAASESIREAVAVAERSSGIKIKRAFISVSGMTLKSDISSGVAIVSKADGEVTGLDINKALDDSEDNLSLGNKKIIHTFPLGFKLDGKEVQGRLEGMHGNKLEIKALFITYSSIHLEDLLEAVALAGVETIDAVASPIASSHVALTEKQKIVGSALVDIGSQTVTLSVFENGLPAWIHTSSIGGEEITNDIALGLKIPLEQAESLKLGTVLEDTNGKKLRDIIEARLEDIFEYVENDLKKIKRNELLPAGIVFVGGGANISGLEELSKSILKLPSRVASTEIFANNKTKLRDPAWFTALGLVLSRRDESGYGGGSLSNIFRDLKRGVKSSIKHLMP